MPRRVQPSQSGSLGLARLGAVWQPAEQLERQLKTARDSIVQLQQQVDLTYRRLALLSFVEHEGSRSADGGTNGLRHKTPNTPQGALHSANASTRAGKVQPLTQQITATSKSLHGAIKERRWPINCPGTDCKSAVDHSVVEAALGSGAAEWYELGIEHGLKNKIYCPNPKCNLLMEREEASDKGKAPSRGQAFNCPYCRHYFCVECLEPGHPGKSCLEAKEYEREREQRQFEALVTENRWQRCPKCTIVIEKLAGCNHMKCTRCPLLKVPETATTDEIREAYKREALRTHPDRATYPGLNGEEPLTREEATALFQQVADAYYVLSNPQRRREYDQARRSHNARRTWTEDHANAHAEPNTIFGNVFEELLRPEVENPSSFYSTIGMASGAALGFICAGIPGVMMGGYAGKKLGQVRDNKGVSVMEAFGRLEQAQRMAILAALAGKLVASLK
ncbi:hypothetical protein BGW42_004023 [Actinomortierella wolfii]|nr:hypothetical protein BGW42_004023 [Actinomortierella wolfii]